MGFEGFYKILVVGGAAVGAGCGASPAVAQSPAPEAAPAAKIEAPKSEAAKPESAQPVPVPAPPAGEAKTTGAADPTPTAPAPAERAVEPKKVGDVDCSKVCSGSPDAETFCPDPAMNGAENCCWLMMKKHACCPG